MGANWDTLNTAAMMQDDDGDGIFTWETILPYGDWEYKVILNQNWDQDTYGGGENFSVSSNGGTLLTIFSYDFSQNSTHNTVNVGDCTLGDMNQDGGWNVLDVVNLVNCVLASNCGEQDTGCAGDMNQDGGWNVLDVVSLVNCVLSSSCGG